MKFNGLNCLVTGGAGFVGSHITESLMSRGSQVTIVDDLSSGSIHNIKHLIDKGAKFENFSILDRDRLFRAIIDVDIVFHQAAFVSVPKSVLQPLKCNQINVEGTLNVLSSSLENGVKKVIYAASSSAYGNTEVLPKVENMPPEPMSPYGVSKLTAEHYCSVYNSVYGLPTTSLRYFNVYGPRQNPNSEYSAVVPKFIKSYSENTAPTIYGDGSQSRDFTFIKDVVSANLSAAKSSASNGEVINIGTGRSTTIRDLASMISNIMGLNLEPKFTNVREGDISHSLADISKAESLINYRPKYRLDEGIKQTAQDLTAE